MNFFYPPLTSQKRGWELPHLQSSTESEANDLPLWLSYSVSPFLKPLTQFVHYIVWILPSSSTIYCGCGQLFTHWRSLNVTGSRQNQCTHGPGLLIPRNGINSNGMKTCHPWNRPTHHDVSINAAIRTSKWTYFWPAHLLLLQERLTTQGWELSG